MGVFTFVENDETLKGGLWVLKELVIVGKEMSFFCLLIPSSWLLTEWPGPR